MDFALTEEQLELQAMVREFVEKEIVPYTDEPSCPGRIWRTGP